MPLPHDFRALGKAPMPPPGQGGNPLQISGNKLQENFEYLDKGMPEGSAGDILVHDGTEWVTLSAPEGSGLHVLGCTGGVVGWVETEECQ